MKSRRSIDAINIPHDIIETTNVKDALMVLDELTKHNEYLEKARSLFNFRNINKLTKAC
jgi:hypothetical protein